MKISKMSNYIHYPKSGIVNHPNICRDNILTKRNTHIHILCTLLFNTYSITKQNKNSPKSDISLLTERRDIIVCEEGVPRVLAKNICRVVPSILTGLHIL